MFKPGNKVKVTRPHDWQGTPGWSVFSPGEFTGVILPEDRWASRGLLKVLIDGPHRFPKDTWYCLPDWLQSIEGLGNVQSR